MKKIAFLSTAAMLVVASLSSCSNKQAENNDSNVEVATDSTVAVATDSATTDSQPTAIAIVDEEAVVEEEVATEEPKEEVQKNEYAGKYTLEQVNCSACAIVSLTVNEDGSAKAEYSGEYGDASYTGTIDGNIVTLNAKTRKDQTPPGKMIVHLNGKKTTIDLLDCCGENLMGEAFSLQKK